MPTTWAMAPTTRTAFIAGIAAAATSLKAASAAFAAAPREGDAEGAHRALISAILPFDDPTFGSHVSVERVTARVDGLFSPLADPSYRAAVLALEDGASVAESLEAWFYGDDVARRRFAVAAKAMAMIAVYSDDAIWTAIGYTGPVLRR